ncbi:MAG: hypothetical protein LBF60_01770 [Treponema sp.]|nr:hypothetical protein [Treponema sp.]
MTRFFPGSLHLCNKRLVVRRRDIRRKKFARFSHRAIHSAHKAAASFPRQQAIKAFAKNRMKPGSEIRTDGLNIYNRLAKEGFVHTAIPRDPKKQPEHLHWTQHIVISNAKAFALGSTDGSLTMLSFPTSWAPVLWRRQNRIML